MINHQPGDVVGHFQVVELLGEGGSGQVWRARAASHEGFSKTVALKLLRPRGRGRESAESLLHEARLGADLRHPNIVDVFDVGVSDGRLHVAMEFVDGGSLERLIERVRSQEIEFPQSVVLDIGIGIAKALAWAHTFVAEDGHARHIVHRDLKPANILLSRSGLPKVADFGLARVLGQTHTTTTGLVRGTPSYMAPETWEGDRSFGPTVDLFALGCILWEMTMLRCLFDGDTIPQVYGAVAYGDPAQEVSPIAERHPGLAPILGKLLQRDPGLRLGDAKQLVAALVTQRGECRPGPDLQEFLASFRPTLRLREELPEAEQLMNLAISPETAVTSERSLGLRIGVLVAVGLAGLWILWGGAGNQEPGNPEGAVPPPAVSFQPTESVVVLGPPSDSLGEDEVERGDSDSSRETLPRDSRIAAASPAAESPAAEARPDARSGAGKAAAGRLAEPSTSPDARSRSASGPAVRTVAPAAAEVSTPAEVSPSSSEACLVLTSSPGGAQVWIDSKLSKRVARSRARRGDQHPPGAVEVSMGGRSPKARVEVELRAGEATKVHCSVGADARCTVSSVSGAYCDD